MAIRTTQQYIQYVAGVRNESNLRITNSYVQVAVILGGSTVFETASNTLGLDAGQSVAQSGGTIFIGASNTFALTAEAENDPVYNFDISQRIFGGTDGITLTSNYYTTSNTFFDGPESSIAGRDYFEDVIQYLGFTDRFFAPDVGNTIGFEANQRVAEAVVDVTANYLFTAPDIDNKVIQAWNADNVVGFNANVIHSTPLNIENTFTFGQDLASSGPANRSIGEVGFIKQTVGFTISDSKCREKEYAPMIGEGADEFKHLAIDAPTISTGLLTLTYPIESPTNTLTLENPDFGNTDTLSFTRIDRNTRGGDRKIFSDPKWASWERLEGIVTDLCEVDADTIIAFLQASLGKEIGLLDWEGRTWSGIVVAPETEVTNDVGGFSFKLTFEGGLDTIDVQHNGDNVIHGQDADGVDIEVEHND